MKRLLGSVTRHLLRLVIEVEGEILSGMEKFSELKHFGREKPDHGKAVQRLLSLMGSTLGCHFHGFTFSLLFCIIQKVFYSSHHGYLKRGLVFVLEHF